MHPDLQLRLDQCNDILKEISALQHNATNGRVLSELSTLTTVVKNGIVNIGAQRLDATNSSRILAVADKAIDHVRTEVAFVAKLLDEGGPGAAWQQRESTEERGGPTSFRFF
jgi:hypothetical protein